MFQIELEVKYRLQETVQQFVESCDKHVKKLCGTRKFTFLLFNETQVL